MFRVMYDVYDVYKFLYLGLLFIVHLCVFSYFFFILYLHAVLI